jgi:hypothetical protein
VHGKLEAYLAIQKILRVDGWMIVDRRSYALPEHRDLFIRAAAITPRRNHSASIRPRMALWFSLRKHIFHNLDPREEKYRAGMKILVCLATSRVSRWRKDRQQALPWH